MSGHDRSSSWSEDDGSASAGSGRYWHLVGLSAPGGRQRLTAFGSFLARIVYLTTLPIAPGAMIRISEPSAYRRLVYGLSLLRALLRDHARAGGGEDARQGTLALGGASATRRRPRSKRTPSAY